MPEIQIDEELSSLIPPLTQDEYSRLEQSIIEEGCRDAIILWGNIIVDGHNRYKICTTHNIPFQIHQKEFVSKDEVKLWMLENQLSRRNLSDLARIEIVRKCEDAVKAEAKKRQGTRTDLLTSGQNFPEVDHMEKFPQSTSRDELGQLAGVSGKTYEHAVAVLDKAPKPVIEAARKKELSINAAYQVTKLLEEKQAEISARIKQGELARKVIAEVQKEPANLKNDLRPIGDVIDIRQTRKEYEIIYLAPDWSDIRVQNEIYLLKTRRLVADKSILLIWCDYENIYSANFAAMQWGFSLKGAAFLWMKKLPDKKDIQSKICLLWTHGDVQGLNYDKQRLIESSGQEEKLSSEEIRGLINEIYGERDAIELYSDEPSAGWDVWMPN